MKPKDSTFEVVILKTMLLLLPKQILKSLLFYPGTCVLSVCVSFFGYVSGPIRTLLAALLGGSEVLITHLLANDVSVAIIWFWCNLGPISLY